MNYIINTKDFINALKCVMKSYNTKSSVTAIRDLMIYTTQNQLELYGTTNEITTKRIIKADLNSTDFKELKICFDPQKMLKGLKLFKEPSTDITIDDKDLFVTLSNGNRNFKVNFSIIKDKEEDSLYESMFGHFVPSYTSDNKCLSYLLERYNSIEFATSKTDARPTLQGINFKENKMCAMDGYILALSEDNSENALVIEGDITIPKDVFVILNNCTKDEIHYKFITDDKHKFVGIKTFDKNDNMITNIVTRIYQGEYFSYETAFPNTHTSDITLKTKPMLDDIKYLNQIQDSKNKMPLHWFKKHLDIEYGSIDIQNSTIINENNVEEIHIGLNIGYLFNIMQHIKTDSFKAEFNNSLKPVVIRTVDSDDYNNLSFLQCPIRISKEKGWEY